MKNTLKTIGLLLLTTILFSSCQKEDSVTAPMQGSNINSQKEMIVKKEETQLTEIPLAYAVSATTYTTSPATNAWTVYSSGSAKTCTYQGASNTFLPGLKARVVSINGNIINVEIMKNYGGTFGASGTGYIKAQQPCGNIAGNASILSNYTYVRVSFTCSFTSESVSFVPTVTLTNGTKMFSNAITVTAKTVANTDYFTSPIISPTYLYSKCLFASKTCAATSHHTGVDYIGVTNAVVNAIADGTVVKVQYMSSTDHGMGNNIILSHKLENGTIIYSTYNHLNSINIVSGQKVIKGQKIGGIGGSGYGKSNYWGTHLHLEIKSCSQTGTCWNGTFWGYTPNHPTTYGYLDPVAYIGKIKFIKN
jgi:murein DD-endopeptidase MepM/ murein hydrolase activator NlpD